MHAMRQIGHASTLLLSARGDMNTLPAVVAQKVNTFMEMTHLSGFDQLCYCRRSAEGAAFYDLLYLLLKLSLGLISNCFCHLNG